MRVRMIQTLSTMRDVFVADKEYELPDFEAEQAIRSGIAVVPKPEDYGKTPVKIAPPFEPEKPKAPPARAKK